MTEDKFTNALEAIKAQIAALNQFVNQSPNLSPELLSIANNLEDATEVLEAGINELQPQQFPSPPSVPLPVHGEGLGVGFLAADSESWLHKLTANIPGVLYIFILRPDGSKKFEYISETCREIQEVEPEEVLENAELLYDQMYPEDRQRVTEANIISATNLETFNCEWRIITKSGNLKWLKGKSRPERRDNGDTVWYGTLLDITEYKQAEASLRENEQRLKLALEIAHMGTWDWDIPNNVVTYSEELGPVFGLQPGEYHPSFENFLTCVHPDDREALQRVITRVQEEGVGYELEFRFFLPDGSLQWIDSKAHVFCDQNNKPLWLVGVVMNITRRKQAEEALRENNERLNLALDAAKMGMWDWDMLTNQVVWSPYHEILLGYEPGIPKRTYSNWAERVHPEDLPRLEAFIQVAMATRQNFDYEYRVVWGDGSIHWVTGIGRCYYNAQGQPIRMLGMIYDITARKQAEEALAHSENLLRKIINSEPECVKTVAADGTLLDMNPAGLAIIEADSLEQVQGKCIYPLIAVEHLPAFMTLVESIFRGESGELEFAIIGIKGTHRWLSTHAVPLENIHGEIIAMLSVTRDITQQKLAQEALQQSQTQLQATVANLTRSNKELEQFAYVASHDLQEPLRKIKSFSQLLAEDYQGQLDTTADEYIHYITNGVTRMQALISDLLIYSRAGRVELNKQPTDLNAVLSQVKQDLSLVISENNAIITASPLPTVPANALQMAQLLQNLIANSIKFRSDAIPAIHIDAQIQQQEWLISVRDNGIGIKPDYNERIFAIFQRLHNRSQYPGTGIGLAVCRKIVERHAGRIWVESDLGKGATFYFTLPTQ